MRYPSQNLYTHRTVYREPPEPHVRKIRPDVFEVTKLAHSDFLAHRTKPALIVDVTDPDAPTITNHLLQPVSASTPRAKRALDAVEEFRERAGT